MNSVVACVEVEKSGHHEEVERLKRDKNVLKQEQQQQSTHNQLQTIWYVQQRQMMTVLAKAVQSPVFLAQFMQQQQNDRNRHISEANMEKVKQDVFDDNELSTAFGKEIVKYQSLMNEAKPKLRQIMEVNMPTRLNSFNNCH